MNTRKTVRWIGLALVAAFVLVACAPAATPTAQVVVQTQVVRETQVVEVQVTTVVRETQVVQQTQIVEVTREPLVIHVAYPSIVDMEDIPSVMAHELLAGQGYSVVPTFYAQPELSVQALSSGDADFGNGADRTFWAANAQGANILTIMEQASNGWSIYAVPDIQACADLGGRIFAQHSEGSVSYAMSRAYIKENCPGTEANILILPGSENRRAALLAGEIEATPVELADAIQIEIAAPGQFHQLTRFAADVPQLKTTLMYVNGDFARDHPDAVKDYIRAVLTVNRMIAADHSLLQNEAAKWLAIDPEVLPKVIEGQFAQNSWDVNGGLTVEAVEYSIQFFTEAGSLEPGLSAAEIADLSFLNAVLDEIGRQ